MGVVLFKDFYICGDIVVLLKLLCFGEGCMVKCFKKVVDYVGILFDDVEKFIDVELRVKIDEFKWWLVDQKNLEIFDDLLFEVFVVVCEVVWWVLDQWLFDVQVMGVVVLYLGNVVEMKIGEGKILICVLFVYFNVLVGNGVYIVIVNDYLVKCDSEWMGCVYCFFGFQVGVILVIMIFDECWVVYNVDIIYGINNEFGFDYLCDNMVYLLDDLVQCGYYYVIVDEVDFILIDEVCILLIIFGFVDGVFNWYIEFVWLVLLMEKDVYYEVDLCKCIVGVYEKGVEFVEDQFGIDNLYEVVNLLLVSYFNNVLKVKELFSCDKDYIVCDGEVFIVDEFIGWVLIGCCYNEGMYQVIEVKEYVEIKVENQMLVIIMLQNYFWFYDKFVGMIGIVQMEVVELYEICKLGVVSILINMLMICEDQFDLIYKIEEVKYIVVVDDVVECYVKGQLVLIGIISVECLEYLLWQFIKWCILYNVFNVKYYE